ncbi:MAG: alanine racemase [Acidimicrobiales bacterium]
MAEAALRPTWAEIDLEALASNVALLREVVAPAVLCAVVKADGYGHGAVRVSRTAIEAGASWLAVAVVDEGIELRAAGIEAPILLLSEPDVAAAEATIEHSITPTVATDEGLTALEGAAKAFGVTTAVHVKVDTGMHRVGVAPERLGVFADSVGRSAHLVLEGVFTHMAVADGPGDEDRMFTELQLDRFGQSLAELGSRGIEPPVRHAANSAAAIRYPSSRLDLVRTGIAIYGELPSAAVADALVAATAGLELQAVRSIHSRVVAVRHLDAGERPSYGRLRPLRAASTVATVPIGYADGVPRRLFESGGEVLIGGRRRPLAGAVTMDQLVVDGGVDEGVAVGDEVVLLGRQGDERIGVAEWAQLLGSVPHEVLTLIGQRVPKVSTAEAGTLRAGGLPRGARGSS